MMNRILILVFSMCISSLFARELDLTNAVFFKKNDAISLTLFSTTEGKSMEIDKNSYGKVIVIDDIYDVLNVSSEHLFILEQKTYLDMDLTEAKEIFPRMIVVDVLLSNKYDNNNKIVFYSLHEKYKATIHMKVSGGKQNFCEKVILINDASYALMTPKDYSEMLENLPVDEEWLFGGNIGEFDEDLFKKQE